MFFSLILYVYEEGRVGICKGEDWRTLRETDMQSQKTESVLEIVLESREAVCI
ncbi:BnaCnng26090D [Brassica napus]|uniref:(rape) hypothetical protein n=1 Tax=Brassica napus TaxID=3708 RepID=A0A078ISI3_BRANA|nr:unnamed protein product [Brassica napus]CDY54040.1 BnaCnng26090D [Brassica napus]